MHESSVRIKSESWTALHEKVRCSHVLIKHKGSRKTHSKRDPEGKEIKQRSKEEASTQLVRYSKDFTNGEITFEELARKVSLAQMCDAQMHRHKTHTDEMM
jgi:hypothetical protein